MSQIAVLGAGVLAIVGAVIFFRYRDRMLAWRAGRIRPGTVLWALVPFTDGSGQKDRPVLVLGAQGRSLKALKLTTQNKAHRRDFLPISKSTWDRQQRQSWLDCGQVIQVDILRVRGTGQRGRITDDELKTARNLVATHSRGSGHPA